MRLWVDREPGPVSGMVVVLGALGVAMTAGGLAVAIFGCDTLTCAAVFTFPSTFAFLAIGAAYPPKAGAVSLILGDALAGIQVGAFATDRDTRPAIGLLVSSAIIATVWRLIRLWEPRERA